MKRSVCRLVIGTAAVTMGVLTPSYARADLGQAVYDDTKEIVEQLLDAEVAASVVPNIACRGPVGLHIYLGETLQAAYTEDFAGMPKTLHAEIADIAASYTYSSIYSVMTGGKATPLSELFGKAPTDEAAIQMCVCQIRNKGLVPQDPATASGNQSQTTVATPPGQTIVAGAQPAPLPPPLCPIVVTDSECKQTSGPQTNPPNASSDQTQVGNSQQTCRTKAIDECNSLDPMSPDYAKKRVACEAGYAVREAIMDNLQNYRADVARAIAALIVFRAKDTASPDLKIDLIAEKLLNDSASQTDDSTGAQGQAAAGTARGTSGAKAAASSNGVTLSDSEQAMLEAVLPAWRVASSGSNRRFEIATALAAAAAPIAVYADAHIQIDTGTKSLIALLRSDTAFTSDLKAILDAASRKELHQLTVKTISATFDVVNVRAQQVCSEDNDDCARAKLAKAFALFATKLAAYLIEAENGTTDDRTAARKAFISATVQLLRDTDTGYQTGLQRDGDFHSFAHMLALWTWGHETPGSRSRFSWLIPSAGMRVSWSEGYVDQSTTSHLRTVPSINWPKFIIPLRRRDWSYLGLQLTLGDIVAPFAEMSLRKDGAYYAHNSQRIWMNAFRPGMDLLIGMPSLSQHLVLGLGGSLRSARLFVDPSDPTNFSYESVFRCPNNYCSGHHGQYFGSFIEANLSAQYIF